MHTKNHTKTSMHKILFVQTKSLRKIKTDKNSTYKKCTDEKLRARFSIANMKHKCTDEIDTKSIGNLGLFSRAKIFQWNIFRYNFSATP